MNAIPIKRHLQFCVLSVVIVFLPGCSFSNMFAEQDGAPSGYVDVAHIPDAVPKPVQKSRYGNPPSYEVLGHRYHVLNSSRGYHATGIASWYGTKFANRKTSDGELYNMYKMTAAHKTLPIPTYVRVTNLENGRHIIVKVNDRGPFKKNRIIDLSYVAAAKLGMLAHGTAMVEVDAITPEALGKEAVTPVAVPHYQHPMVFLQVGAYRDYANAKRVQAAVSRVVPATCHVTWSKTKGGGVLYRVQIGPIASVDISDRINNELEAMGYGKPVTIIKDEPTGNLPVLG